ncbi:hypothetical protein D0T50_02895 [Bacteroides sp. 214]|uniref:hypothetical protein n=1 Tax=Bacteroides sp. 214 TaxID=2302935 RepID=UPI0013D71A19|nr:hypothetical protein [Bacteroides sp. 214]NDW11834.1 hypothetical protein [Bacteroides sp. 214]
MTIKATEFTLFWLMPSIAFGSIALLASYEIGTDFNHHWLIESGVFLIVLFLLLTIYWLLQTTFSDIFFSKASLTLLSPSTDNVSSNLQDIKIQKNTNAISDTNSPIDNIVSTCLHKSILIESEKRQKAKLDKQRRTLILVEYTNAVLTNHMKKIHLEIILKNVNLFATSPEANFIPIETDGSLSTADLRHFAWNIGKRLGYERMIQAKFIKQCFPKEFMNCELPTIIRNLSDEVSSIIKIDKPDKGSYDFHWETIGLINPLDISSDNPPMEVT